MDRTGRTRPTAARLVITPGALVLLFGAIIMALLARNLFVASRRQIAWAVASLVMAAAIEPAVSLMSRYARRGVALILVLVPLIAVVGAVANGVYTDLDRSTTRLQRSLPEAAATIERSERFGEMARQLDLRQRTQEAVDKLEKPSASAANEAVGSGSTWLLCTILTIFALAWGPRFASGALKQLDDEARRDRLARIVGRAFQRSQAYVDASLIQGLVVGFGSWLLFRAYEVPVPTPLALLVGVMSVVPLVGLFIGSLPAVMLVAGFESFSQAGTLLAIMVAAQLGQVLFFRAVTKRTLYVGPAIIVIAYLIGLDVYGLGGAVFGTAMAVFGVALLDALAEEQAEEQHPAEADPLTTTVEDGYEDAGTGDQQADSDGSLAGGPAAT